MNARELLKEARKLLLAMAEWNQDVDAIIGHTPKTGFEDASGLLKRIDAYLATTSESAMEMVAKIRQTHTVCSLDQFRGKPISYLSFDIHDSDAAALIKDYAERETAALRDLVRKMRIAGNMVRDAMPNSVAVHNWIDVCAEAGKVLGN